MQIKEFFLALIPRLITDTVVLDDNGDHYGIVCSMIYVQPDEQFDAVCEMKTFTWFCWSVPYGEPINVRPFIGKD